MHRPRRSRERRLSPRGDCQRLHGVDERRLAPPACTGDGAGRIALFLDGAEVASDRSGSYQMPGPGQTLALGSGPNPIPLATWRFNGRIDEFRISNRRMYFAAFTPSRRLTLETSTVALYHFDDGAGASAMDEVGPGRHTATLDMGATWAPE